jgi:hypothetical protein
MGRWDISEDARPLEPTSDRTPARTETSHHDHDARITPLPDRVSPRSRPGLGEGREHHLTLPGGREREEVRDSGRVYDLRGSEVDLLERAGRYRVTLTDDLKHDASHPRFDEDLRSLKEQGLIKERTVTHLREGTVADVVSVTPAGQSVLDHHRDPEHDQGVPAAPRAGGPGAPAACLSDQSAAGRQLHGDQHEEQLQQDVSAAVVEGRCVS